MQSDASPPRFLRVSTRALPALDRMPFWREAFARLHLGTAAALAVALFAVLIVMTIGYGRVAR